MRYRAAFAATLLIAAAIAGSTAAAAVDPSTEAADALIAQPNVTPATAEAVAASCERYLEHASGLRKELEARTGPATIEADFREYDTLRNVLQAARFDAQLTQLTNPDGTKRAAAESCLKRASDATNSLLLSEVMYGRLAMIDASKADLVARHLLARTLSEYRRSGVSAGPDERAKVADLRQRIAAAEIAFSRNIGEARKSITADSADLEGLPADYLAAHPPGPDGMVRITTDYPDLRPVMIYAMRDDLRQRLNLASLTRAPQNQAVLNELIAARSELAKILDRPDFASLALEDKMLSTPARARAFLEELSAVSDAPARAEHARLLRRYQSLVPEAQELPPWSLEYVGQVLLKEEYDVDPQLVRRYFAYDKVRDGVFRLTQDLFGVKIRPWNTTVWHASVQAYEVLEDGQVIGRFFLDNQPREGKYNHLRIGPIRMGLRDRNLPVVAMIGNFPTGDHSTGLMEHGQAVQFFHEFGHMLHVIFSGRNDWSLQNTGRVEWDFIEVPSQMLENWVWDYDTLKTFAVDAQGNTIPRELVSRMNKARYFTLALNTRRQLALSSASLTFHEGSPPADIAETYEAAFDGYSLVKNPEGAHTWTSWTHLADYSAYYYTYLWSETISDDLFSAFQSAGLRDRATAERYRRLVLAPGAGKPAAQLVGDFLGRPPNLEAYRRKLTPETNIVAAPRLQGGR